MKKIIAILLLVVILLPSLSFLFVFAVNSGEYTQNSISVDVRGEKVSLDVFVSEDGTILVPADILTFWGGLKRVTVGSEYVYSKSGSRRNEYLERKIYISTNGSYGKSVITIFDERTLAGVDVNFSDSYTISNNYK